MTWVYASDFEVQDVLESEVVLAKEMKVGCDL